LKEFANVYSISENDLKHSITLAKDLLRGRSRSCLHRPNNFFHL